MSFVCLWIPHWPTSAGLGGGSGGPLALSESDTDLAATLLAITPHAVVEARGVIWLDARGLDTTDTARRAHAGARRAGARMVRMGVASTAIAAEVAAIHGHSPLVIVPVEFDVTFLAPFPLTVLTPSPHLAAALADLGLVTCGDLARLPREAVEVRFGTDGVALWRLARADDPRRIFTPAPRALPSASLVWEEYVLRDPEQLVFVANRLVAAVCAELRDWGETARALTLRLTLTDRTEVERTIRTSRDTASRAAWMRLIRLELNRLYLPGQVVGLSVRMGAAGNATLDKPASRHPLPEQRATWRVREPDGTAIAAALPTTPDAPDTWPGAPQLLLQVFPELRRITVKTTRRHDHQVPARFRTPEGQDTALLTVVGPDEVLAGPETGTPNVREYFTCLTDNGLLVLIFRDTSTNMWYLHGWWD